MTRKTIISDFSALKGKVTFSEKTSSAKVSPKVTPATATPKPKDSNDGLKIGQSVILMDSNLRGKIVGLGKTVRIELEDGLVIESDYGEFAVTDKAEIASLKETKVKAKKLSPHPSILLIRILMVLLPLTCTSKPYLVVAIFLRASSCSSRRIPSERLSGRICHTEERKSTSFTA